MGIPDGAHTHGHGHGGSGPAGAIVLIIAPAMPGPPVAAAAVLHSWSSWPGLSSEWVPPACRSARLAVAPAGRGPRRPPGSRSGVLAPRSGAGHSTLPASRPAIEYPTEVHLHLHGVFAEDLAAILRSQDGPRGTP
jgi:hypothetical protein